MKELMKLPREKLGYFKFMVFCSSPDYEGISNLSQEAQDFYNYALKQERGRFNLGKTTLADIYQTIGLDLEGIERAYEELMEHTYATRLTKYNASIHAMGNK